MCTGQSDRWSLSWTQGQSHLSSIRTPHSSLYPSSRLKNRDGRNSSTFFLICHYSKGVRVLLEAEITETPVPQDSPRDLRRFDGYEEETPRRGNWTSMGFVCHCRGSLPCILKSPMLPGSIDEGLCRITDLTGSRSGEE